MSSIATASTSETLRLLTTAEHALIAAQQVTGRMLLECWNPDKKCYEPRERVGQLHSIANQQLLAVMSVQEARRNLIES